MRIMLSSYYNGIDVLVNNAAINDMVENPSLQLESSAFENYPLELWNKVIDVNLTGTFLCSQVIGSHMASRKSGSIINIGSQKPIKIRDLILKIIKLIGKGKPIFSKIKIRSDEPIRLYPDISKAKDILNWYPKFSLEKGLKKTINYYRKNGKKN